MNIADTDAEQIICGYGYYYCKDRRAVELEWDSDKMTAWTAGETREEIGRITFLYIEGASENGDDEYYLVTNMHLEGPNDSRDYTGQGIGREIIKRVGANTPIVFAPDDGNLREDGSHLTEMGPEFAKRMVSEGLASWGY